MLTGLSEEEIARACPSARMVSVAHRGTIYRQGESAGRIYYIVDGQVTFARLNVDGEMLTTAMLSAGSFFGALLNGDMAAEDTAKAKGKVLLWRAPLEEFQRLLAEHPSLSWQFIAMLAQRQRQIESKLELWAFKPVEARLAAVFRELSGGFAMRCEHGFGQHLRLTQQELADLVGASRPVVSTILNRLRKQGVLGYSREYVCVRRIEDIESLIES